MLGGTSVDPAVTPAGAMLGKYELVRRLATGGMAELFLARASAIAGFEKVVVLKRILPQYAENDEFIRMFLSEARLAATLHHPNIVQVYDIGEHAQTYFFTMEYVMGQDLRKLVRAARKAERALPLEHILHVIMGVAAGLAHAHDKVGNDGRPLGIVHRDVSPSNVLVTYDGGVKVVDFGIAKAASSQNNTVAGTLKGKIPYMSPEQCRGEHVDARSDIFSIGTLLWELTTGTRLFAGDNEFALINRVAQGDVPTPTSVRPDYPPELEAIVMRALQADREDRYASALDLQIDLEDFAREARLPVSSARMAKFMRELFAREITAGREAMLPEPAEEPPTKLQPTQNLLKGDTVAVPVGATELLELTPSEVRSGQVMPTPGPVAAASYTAGSATDISYRPPPNSRPVVVLAVVVTVMLLVGAAGGFAWRAFNKSDEPETAGQAATPDAERDATKSAEPPSKEAEPAEPEPLEIPDDPPVADPTTDPAAASADGSPLDSSADAGATDPAAPEPAPAKDAKTGTGQGAAKKGSSKRPPKKRPPKSEKPGDASKPQWDPDSPFPI